MTTAIRSEATRSVVVVNGVDRLAVNEDGSMELLTPPSTSDANDLLTRALGGPVVTATKVATGAFVDFDSIPSWAKRITVTFNQVSTNGSSQYLVQIGSSAGVEPTGYESSGSSGTSGFTTSIGFVACANTSAAAFVYGSLTLRKHAGNRWISDAQTVGYPGFVASLGTGGKSLAGTLDRLRITTQNGTDQFDGGNFAVTYE